MKILEIQGLITSKTGPGGGVFISAMAPADAIQLLDNLFLFKQPSIADIYAMRKLLEPELAAGLAGKLTPRAFAALQATIRLYEEEPKTAEEEYQQRLAELDFHAELARQSGNEILGFVCVFLLSLLRDMTVCREIYSRPNPELRERGLHYQVQLLRAIKAGDAERARSIMREHMEEAERYMLARAAMRGWAGPQTGNLTMPGKRADHTIHGSHRHFGWDNAIAPAMHCAPGDTITFDCHDAGNGHYTAASTAADIATMNPDEINPVTGPVFVDGAEPGDALKVTIHDFAPSGFGWTAIIPGFGLLADQFTEPHLHLWTYDRTGARPAMFGRQARVPVRPFAGTIGVAPAEPGHHSVIPPRSVGGNMDIRDLTAGAVLICPWRCRGRCFPSATPMPHRATARSAARRSKAPWRRP